MTEPEDSELERRCRAVCPACMGGVPVDGTGKHYSAIGFLVPGADTTCKANYIRNETIPPDARRCKICWRLMPAVGWTHCMACGGLGCWQDYEYDPDGTPRSFGVKCQACSGEGHKAPKETK